MSAESTLDFSVGSTFLMLIDGKRLPVQVKVLSREGENVEVMFSSPKRPRICDKCGCTSGLSQNAVTGVVVCMTTGCGKDFGYAPGGVNRKMKISDFVKIPDGVLVHLA